MLQILENLSRINGLLMRASLPIIKKEDLSTTEMMILWKVSRKKIYRATDLARETGIPPSTFTGIFDRLVARGLLDRVNDQEDRRSVLVQGTPELKELIDRIKELINMKLKDVFKDMPEELVQQFIENLQMIHQYLLQNESDNKEGGQHGKCSEK